MQAAAYSFLDVAVVDGIRQRFAAGDAICVLSLGLKYVFWANGQGAAILGYDNIDAAIGATSRLGLTVRRQIAATLGFPDIGCNRVIMVCFAAGVTGTVVAFMASVIRLPDGEKVIMLAVPAVTACNHRETAAAAIGGFTESDHFLAFIDARGDVEASTLGFDGLGIATSTLVSMVISVRNERDRLLARAIPTFSGRLPAGIARLTDNRHLLITGTY